MSLYIYISNSYITSQMLAVKEKTASVSAAFQKRFVAAQVFLRSLLGTNEIACKIFLEGMRYLTWLTVNVFIHVCM